MKFSDYIKINDSFQYSINLQFDIGNINKIKEYIPTTDSCEVMEYYIDSILGNFNKSTTLIGPYGKGKSHLLLVIMTLLNDYNVEDNTILNALIKKINTINDDLAIKIREIRDKKLKYLPVIINSNYNNLNQAFLLALHEALEREHINNVNIESYFNAALEIILRWEKSGDKEILNKFDECLKKNSTSLKELKTKLNMFDDEGYKDFKDVYSCIMHGIEFNPIINSDIVKYYRDVNYKINQIGYNGILIVFDEFSKFLEYIGNENMMRDLKIIQDFAEVSSRTGKNEQIIFSCITHKTINEYIKDLKEDKVNAFKTVEGRFKEIYFNRSMEQNYEIISQTIKKDKNGINIIKKAVQNNIEFYNSLRENFKFCNFDKVDEKLFEGCYPLNPITVYSVINLSEKIAQNERTLFTFLTDDDPNSFKFYINNSQSNNLFSLDKVYDYFYNIFRKETNENIKNTWLKAENTLNKTQEVVERKILKSLAIIYMINDFDNLMPNYEAIRLSINIEKDKFERSLNNLIDKALIKKKKSNKLYDFSTIYNKELITEIDRIAETRFNNISIKDSINNNIHLGYIIPRRYNQHHKMTRFFKQVFLEEEEFLNLKSLKILKKQYFCDGYIINILRNSNSIQQIIEKCSLLADNNVIIKIPKECISKDLKIALKESAAIEYIKRTENLDEDSLNEILLIEEDIRDLIVNEISTKYDNANIKCLCYMNDTITSQKLNTLCSTICENIYCDTPIINNEMINKEEISKPIQKAREIVIETVLNNDTELIKSSTSAEATIYNAIVKKKDNSDIRKIINIISSFIKETEKNGKRNFDKLTNKLKSQPYGIRKGILPILLAIGIQEYKENIILYYQSKEIDVNATNIEKIFDEPDKYYIYIEKGTIQKVKYIKNLSKIYKTTYTDIQRNNIKEIVLKMKNWALGLPRIARELNEVNDIVYNYGFILIKNSLLKEDINNNEFLFKIIPDALSTYNFDTISEQLSKMKDIYDHYTNIYIEQLIPLLKEKFKHKSNSSMNNLLKEWYKNLDDSVKNSVVSFETKELFNYINSLTTFNDVEIFQDISNIVIHYYVEDWQKNSCSLLFDKIDNILNNIKETKNNVPLKKESVIISTGDDQIRKYINNVEISSLGRTLKNNIEDSIEEYGNSISESEKIKILLEIVKKFM